MKKEGQQLTDFSPVGAFASGKTNSI